MPVEVTYGDSIVYQGLSNVVRSIVTLNHDDKKLHVTSTNEQIHSYFNNELYMGITLYDKTEREKACNCGRARNFKRILLSK